MSAQSVHRIVCDGCDGEGKDFETGDLCLVCRGDGWIEPPDEEPDDEDKYDTNSRRSLGP